MLFAFFVTSVTLSFVGRARKQLLIDIAKGGPRDAWQVAANGGVATLCAIAAGAIAPAAPALFWGYAGAYAAATADTWSTEIGSAFGGTPRSLIGFAPIATGLSGGVTLLGSVAMVAGAAWIGCVWSLLLHRPDAFWIVTIAGVAGALADSLLGATLQSMRYCNLCKRATELAMHVCGNEAEPLRGAPWMTNDAVNAIATLVGALVSAVLFVLLAR